MRKQTVMWTTRDGQRMRICDMSDTHLMNAIAYFRRTGANALSAETSAAWSLLGMLQGEMAQVCCESDIATLEETSVDDFIASRFPLFEKLLAEAQRRGLLISELEQECILSAFGDPEWWK